MATEALTLLMSNKADIIRQNSIDYSKNLIYTVYRTDVCVYKGVHGMKDYKELLNKLLDELTSNQIKYIYHLTSKLFGHAPD